MRSYRLMFPQFRSSLMFSGFGLKPPASGFQFYFTVASRLLHLYSTDDKTSRLKMKSFSTLRDTQRGSLFLKTMVCFSGCLMSSASLQKLFCGICSALKCSFEEFVREKVIFPSYSSAIFPSLSLHRFQITVVCFPPLAPYSQQGCRAWGWGERGQVPFPALCCCI